MVLTSFKFIYLLFSLMVIYSLTLIPEKNENKLDNIGIETNNIRSVNSSFTIYELVNTYSEKYDVPKYIIYNILYKETTYLGPFHWKYNPSRESNVGAVGPMQIMLPTCNWVNKKNFNKQDLKGNLKLNIITGIKYLSYLKSRYHNWEVVCGYYNTGKPIINDYAKYCANNRNYRVKWKKY